MQLVKNIQPDFVDDRGEIIKLLDDGKTSIKSILLINSKKGSIRANHYHKEDAHYVYMYSGKMEYVESPLVNDQPDLSREEKAELVKGDMIYSPPMIAHAMRFLEDTVWVVMALKSRSQENYEADTVRVKLI